MLANLSIKARLLLLSSGLVLLIAALTLYLTHKLTDNANAVTRNAELAKLIDVAQDVRNTFGEYRYGSPISPSACCASPRSTPTTPTVGC